MVESIYQTLEWKEAMEASGYKAVDVEGMVVFENNIVSLIGQRKIIFARGTLSNAVLNKFKTKAKEYWYGTITPKITDYDDRIFKKLGFKRFDDHTIMVDLKKDKEELWKDLEKKSIRWGVKTAEKNGLVFEEAQEEDIKDFYKLYKDTADKGGFKAESQEFFEKINKLMVSKGMVKIFVIKKGNEILAGCIMLVDTDHTMLHLTGANDEGYKLQAMPFLYWKVILSSKELGKEFIDLGGFDKEAKSGDKTYNINKFKQRFGGEIVAQPIYATNWRYVFIRKQMHWLRSLKKIYHKEKTIKE